MESEIYARCNARQRNCSEGLQDLNILIGEKYTEQRLYKRKNQRKSFAVRVNKQTNKQKTTMLQGIPCGVSGKLCKRRFAAAARNVYYGTALLLLHERELVL